MNKKLIMGSLAIILLVLVAFWLKNNNQPQQIADTIYTNDKYGFTLMMDKDFENSVEEKEEGSIVYFVSKEIQARNPGMIFGVIGRIQIYNKAEFTKETMLQSGEAYGLKYLGENGVYYFGWAHATDVQTPPGNVALEQKYRALETKFEEVLKTFKAKQVAAPEVEIYTGRYVGLADNNFFEVKTSGAPDENASKVFMIADKIRAKFESLNLQPDEEIKIKYIQNKDGQNVVQDIERIKG